MKAKLLETRQEAGNAKSFYFKPHEPVMWEPGQYMECVLGDTDNKSSDNRHWFTIASAPEDKFIQITTRLSGSDYKNRLDSLQVGQEVNILDIQGDFTVKNNKPTVFIAGGIGITPFHSILRSRHLKGEDLDALLIYANRNSEIIYHKELELYKESMPSLRISYVTGSLTIDIIKDIAEGLMTSSVYLSGPEPMVESLGNELLKSGVPEASLIRDWFPGYDETNF